MKSTKRPHVIPDNPGLLAWVARRMARFNQKGQLKKSTATHGEAIERPSSIARKSLPVAHSASIPVGEKPAYF